MTWTGVTTVEHIKYFYQHLSDNHLNDTFRNKIANLILDTFINHNPSLRRLTWTNYSQKFRQTKLKLKKPGRMSLLQSKPSETILDTEKVDGHSAKTAVYEFLKGLYDDIKPEEQSNHVRKAQVEGLLTKAEELVAQVKKKGKASPADEVKTWKAA